ncbi:MAG TPA: GrpB family protein [Thermomicrobiales bacterium]|nr:GrpB family protein [Thermomicrobiales bacterium]
MPFDPHDPNADPTIPVNTLTQVNGQVTIVDYDPAWPEMYAREEARIRETLGDRAVLIEHIGSTAVPGLPAKPCIDIVLAVPDSSDEPAYVPDLESAGYVLRIREPDNHEHRCFKGAAVNLNLHVWTQDDPEIERHLSFRDWLRTHPADRDLYAATKRDLARRHWKIMQDYADAKNDIVREIQGHMSNAS